MSRVRAVVQQGDDAEYRGDTKANLTLAAYPRTNHCARVICSKRAGRARDATAILRQLRRPVVIWDHITRIDIPFPPPPCELKLLLGECSELLNTAGLAWVKRPTYTQVWVTQFGSSALLL